MRHEYLTYVDIQNNHETDGDLEFGFLPPNLLNDLRYSSDRRTRMGAIEAVQRHLQELFDARPLLPELSGFVKFLCSLLNDDNFTVLLTTIAIIGDLVEKVGRELKSYLRYILPTLVEKFGDNYKVVVRQKNIQLFNKMIDKLSPAPVMGTLLSSLAHENWKVRQHVVLVVTYALLSNSVYNYDYSRIIRTLVIVLEDPRPPVKQAAQDALMVIHNAIGSKAISMIKNTGALTNFQLDQLVAKFKVSTLPRVNRDGSIEPSSLFSSGSSTRDHRHGDNSMHEKSKSKSNNGYSNGNGSGSDDGGHRSFYERMRGERKGDYRSPPNLGLSNNSSSNSNNNNHIIERGPMSSSSPNIDPNQPYSYNNNNSSNSQYNNHTYLHTNNGPRHHHHHSNHTNSTSNNNNNNQGRAGHAVSSSHPNLNSFHSNSSSSRYGPTSSSMNSFNGMRNDKNNSTSNNNSSMHTASTQSSHSSPGTDTSASTTRSFRTPFATPHRDPNNKLSNSNSSAMSPSSSDSSSYTYNLPPHAQNNNDNMSSQSHNSNGTRLSVDTRNSTNTNNELTSPKSKNRHGNVELWLPTDSVGQSPMHHANGNHNHSNSSNGSNNSSSNGHYGRVPPSPMPDTEAVEIEGSGVAFTHSSVNRSPYAGLSVTGSQRSTSNPNGSNDASGFGWAAQSPRSGRRQVNFANATAGGGNGGGGGRRNIAGLNVDSDTARAGMDTNRPASDRRHITSRLKNLKLKKRSKTSLTGQFPNRAATAAVKTRARYTPKGDHGQDRGYAMSNTQGPYNYSHNDNYDEDSGNAVPASVALNLPRGVHRRAISSAPNRRGVLGANDNDGARSRSGSNDSVEQFGFYQSPKAKHSSKKYNFEDLSDQSHNNHNEGRRNRPTMKFNTLHRKNNNTSNDIYGSTDSNSSHHSQQQSSLVYESGTSSNINGNNYHDQDSSNSDEPIDLRHSSNKHRSKKKKKKASQSPPDNEKFGGYYERYLKSVKEDEQKGLSSAPSHEDDDDDEDDGEHYYPSKHTKAPRLRSQPSYSSSISSSTSSTSSTSTSTSSGVPPKPKSHDEKAIKGMGSYEAYFNSMNDDAENESESSNTSNSYASTSSKRSSKNKARKLLSPSKKKGIRSRATSTDTYSAQSSQYTAIANGYDDDSSSKSNVSGSGKEKRIRVPGSNFKRSMPTTPSKNQEVNYTESADFQPTSNPAAEFKSILRTIKSTDWRVRFDALDSIRRLCIHHITFIEPHVRALTRDIKTELDSLRSGVGKNAIMCCRDMFLNLGKSMDNELEMLLPGLVKRAGESNKFLAEEAGLAIQSMLECCTDARIFNALLTIGTGGLSKNCKAMTVHFMDAAIAFHGHRVPHLREFTRLLQAIGSFLSGASSKQRNSSKNCIVRLMRVMGRSDLERAFQRNVSASLFAGVKKILDKGMNQAIIDNTESGSLTARKAATLRNRGATRRAQTTTTVNKNKSNTYNDENISARHSYPGGGGGLARDDDYSLHSSRGDSSSRSTRSIKTPMNSHRRKTSSRSRQSMEKDKESGFPVLAKLPDVLTDINAPEWRTRMTGITKLVNFITDNPEAANCAVLKIFDKFSPRLTDSNRKVNMAALQALEQIVPIMRDSLNTVITTLVPALTNNLATTNPPVRKLTRELVDTLIVHCNESMLLQSFSGIVMYGNARIKAVMLGKVQDVTQLVYDRRPQTVVKYVVPLAFSLIDENKSDIRNANRRLLRCLYILMGDSLLEPSLTSKLSAGGLQSLRNITSG